MAARSLRQLLHDRRGAALVEFGLVAPVLALVIMGVTYAAIATLKTNAMHAAVSSGAQYVMAGGTDMGVAQQVVAAAWPGKTAQAVISAVKVCRCAGATAACGTLCSDQSVPQAFVTISGADQLSFGRMSRSLATQEEVRIR